MDEVTHKVRRICARLLNEPPDTVRWERYRSDLKAAMRELEAEQEAWGNTSETDTPQDEARQAYRSREKDSADAFAEGMKLFNPKKRDSEKKTD